MAIHPNDGQTLQARLQAWVASGNKLSDAALIAYVLNGAQTIGDVVTGLPTFHINQISGGKHGIDDYNQVRVLDFSLTTSVNPGHTVVRIY